MMFNGTSKMGRSTSNG